MKASERAAMLDFISKYACDDIIIQVMNRVTNNLEDTKTLMEYMNGHKPSVVPTIMTTEEADAKINKDLKDLGIEKAEVVDLGPACKKLGRNGQDILAYIEKNCRDKSIRLGALCQQLKLPESKVKPMLALLLEREKITYTTFGFQTK